MEYGLHCDGSIWIQQCLLSLCSTYRLISNIIYKQNTLERFSPLEASKVACQKNIPPSSGLFANRWRQWESNFLFNHTATAEIYPLFLHDAHQIFCFFCS